MKLVESSTLTSEKHASAKKKQMSETQKLVKKIMNASKERVKKHRAASKQRRARAQRESKKLDSFVREMSSESQKKLFKDTDRSVQCYSSKDKPLSLYYAVSADNTSTGSKVNPNKSHSNPTIYLQIPNLNPTPTYFDPSKGS